MKCSENPLVTLPEAANVSTKAVMLSNGLKNLPAAGQSRGKNHAISSTKPNGFTRLRRHDNLTLKKKTGFPLVIGPGKGADLAAPDRPITHAL